MIGEGKGGELGLDGVAEVEGDVLGGGFAGDALDVIEDAFEDGESEEGEDGPGEDAGLVGFDAGVDDPADELGDDGVETEDDEEGQVGGEDVLASRGVNRYRHAKEA